MSLSLSAVYFEWCDICDKYKIFCSHSYIKHCVRNEFAKYHEICRLMLSVFIFSILFFIFHVYGCIRCVINIYRVAQKVSHYHESLLNRIKTRHWRRSTCWAHAFWLCRACRTARSSRHVERLVSKRDASQVEFRIISFTCWQFWHSRQKLVALVCFFYLLIENVVDLTRLWCVEQLPGQLHHAAGRRVEHIHDEAD